MAGSVQTFHITSLQKRYLEQQLDKVSRSFAILIPYIEVPLRHYLGVAYLLCRVADNVEDCGQPQAWKKERLDEFMHLLQEPQQAAAQFGVAIRQRSAGLRNFDGRDGRALGLRGPIARLLRAALGQQVSKRRHHFGIADVGNVLPVEFEAAKACVPRLQKRISPRQKLAQASFSVTWTGSR